jgi:F-type H+-transporting ATPase subunit b
LLDRAVSQFRAAARLPHPAGFFLPFLFNHSSTPLRMPLTFLANAAEGAAQPNIFQQLGINYGGLIAQILIFCIVYFVLSKYAFGPVTAILEERRKRIIDGEDNLKKIKSDLETANAQAAEIRAKAEADASRIVKEATDAAGAVGEAKRQQAIAEAAQIVAKSREASQLERERLLADLKNEFGRLVIDTTSKVTGKVLTGDDHSRISQEALAQIAL